MHLTIKKIVFRIYENIHFTGGEKMSIYERSIFHVWEKYFAFKKKKRIM